MPVADEVKIVIRADDQASGVLSKTSKGLSDMGSRFSAIGGLGKLAAGAIGVAGAALGGLGAKALQGASSLEQTQIAFTTMLGSAEKANAFIKDLTKFAAETPFELPQLEDASKKLLAFGIDAGSVLPNLKAIGDIASGVGMDKLPNLINAFGQVSAAGKLMGQDLLQFTSAGVPLLDELAKSMGKSTSEIKDMVSKGQIGFADVQKALQNLSGEGGRFNDLMKKQAQTFGGMMSNVSDAFGLFLRQQGQPLIEWGKKFAAVLLDIINVKLPEMMKQINLQKLVEGFGNLALKLIDIAMKILPPLVAAFNFFMDIILEIGNYLSNWASKDKTREMFQELGKMLSSVSKIFIDFGRAVLPYVLDALTDLVLLISRLYNTLRPFIEFVAGTVTKVFEAWGFLISAITGSYVEMTGTINSSSQSVQNMSRETENMSRNVNRSLLSTGTSMTKMSFDTKAAADSFHSSVSGNLEKTASAAKKRAVEIKDSLEKVKKAMESVSDEIVALQKKQTDLEIEDAQRSVDFRADMAKAYVDQERDVAKLKADLENKKTENVKESSDREAEIRQERDYLQAQKMWGQYYEEKAKRDLEIKDLEDELKRQQDALEEHKTIEIGFVNEVKSARDFANLTSFEQEISQITQKMIQKSAEHGQKMQQIQEELTQKTLQMEQLKKLEEDLTKTMEEEKKKKVNIIQTLKEKTDSLISSYDRMADSATRAFRAGSSIQNMSPALNYTPAANMSRLPSFDVGGTVPGPIGAPMMAVVHGGEMVVPPGKGGGIVINMTGNSFLDGRMAERVVDMMINRLKLELRI